MLQPSQTAFPGADTPGASFPGALLNPGFVAAVALPQVQAAATKATTFVSALRTTANALGQAAESAIAAAAATSPPKFDPIKFANPVFVPAQPEYFSPTLATVPGGTTAASDIVPFDVQLQLSPKPEKNQGDIDAPEAPEVKTDYDFAPTLGSKAPPEFDITPPEGPGEPPQVNFSPGLPMDGLALDSDPEKDLSDLDTDGDGKLTKKEIDEAEEAGKLTKDEADELRQKLDDQEKDRYTPPPGPDDFVGGDNDVSFDPLIPPDPFTGMDPAALDDAAANLFALVGNIASAPTGSGAPSVDGLLGLIDKIKAPAMGFPEVGSVIGANLWGGSGFDAPDAQALIGDLVSTQKAEGFREQIELEGHRAKVSIALQELTLRIALRMYVADMERAIVQASTEIQRIKQNVTAYKAAVAKFRQSASSYEIGMLGVETQARRISAGVKIEAIKGDIAGVLASAYSTKVRAEETKLDIMDAKIQRYEAELEAGRAVAEAQEAQSVESEILSEMYKGLVEQWGAEIKEISTQYQYFSAAAQVPSVLNQLEALKPQVSSAQYRAQVARANDANKYTGVEAAMLRAEIARRASLHATVEEKNKAEAIRVGNLGTADSIRAANESVRMLGQIPVMSATADAASTAARLAESVMQSTNRAAELSQAANIQIANTYATLHDALGRASAAVASGKLSGFRGSQTIDATYRIDGSVSNRGSGSFDGTTTISESDEYEAEGDATS